EFFTVSAGGMLIGLACLWVSHYLLGFHSLLADNIAGNVVGLALGTAFRFWGYRVWVFREVTGFDTRPATPDATQPTRSRPATPDATQPTRSRATEGTVAPAGFAPASRIQAVSTVDDDARGHH